MTQQTEHTIDQDPLMDDPAIGAHYGFILMDDAATDK